MKRYSIIHLFGIIGLIFIISPIIYLLLQVFNFSGWALKSELLINYSKNTLLMVAIVGSITAVLGVSLAWIVTFYDFPFRRFFKVLLALPLAIPPYIAAHSYADFMYSGGLLNKALLFFGVNKYFDIMNFSGAVFVYIVTLYPYVYLMCLSFYKNSSASLIDNARVLNAGSLKLFFKVGLPMARLPVVAGTTLAIMELVSDFGVVDYYGVQVFSTGIYKTWLNYSDFNGAIKLSSILLVIILSIVLLESGLRRRLRYFTSSKTGMARRIKTKTSNRLIIYFLLTFVLLVGFIIPVVQLFYNSYYVYEKILNAKLMDIIFTTFYYSALSSIICVIISFSIANLTKTHNNKFTTFISKLATMGYSIPGVIVGLSVIFTFIDVDKVLVPIYRIIGIESKVLVLSTSVFILVFAYIVRFLAVSYNNIYSGYKKINPNLFKASHTLGKNDFKTFFKVDIPLMFPTLLTAFLLVFLEIIKELPITLMLKPYNIETLTGRVYMYVHNEQYAEASVPSLIIIFLGIIIVSLVMLYREEKNVES